MAEPQAIHLWEEKEDFYVPQFEVRIRSRKLPQNVVYDVTQVSYKDSQNFVEGA